MKQDRRKRLSYNELLKLKMWSTPAIYNGWEAITKHNTVSGHFNREETKDFMPHMGPMTGYAVTVVFEPDNMEYAQNNPNAWNVYYKYIASIDGPKIVVLQDLNKPEVLAACWGEITSNAHKSLGCVGTITDGAIRDVDEMCNVGFKAIARCMNISHAFGTPVRWGCEVEVFGCKVKPGQLIHADMHGFLVIPKEDEERLVEATLFMDNNEKNILLSDTRNTSGKSKGEILKVLDESRKQFRNAVKKKFWEKKLDEAGQ